ADAIAKTLLADDPSLRVIAVAAANELWVMAPPEQHFALMAKIKDSITPGITGSDTKTIYVTSDPTELVAKLVKLFPSTNGGPTIESGIPGSLSIIVKGPAHQIAAGQKAVHELEGTQPGGNGANQNPHQRRLMLPDGSASI